MELVEAAVLVGPGGQGEAFSRATLESDIHGQPDLVTVVEGDVGEYQVTFADGEIRGIHQIRIQKGLPADVLTVDTDDVVQPHPDGRIDLFAEEGLGDGQFQTKDVELIAAVGGVGDDPAFYQQGGIALQVVAVAVVQVLEFLVALGVGGDEVVFVAIRQGQIHRGGADGAVDGAGGFGKLLAITQDAEGCGLAGGPGLGGSGEEDPGGVVLLMPPKVTL